MHPLLQRILVNGLIAASLLALMGYGLAELGRMWLIAQAPARAQPGAPVTVDDGAAEALGTRLPLTMAAWGVGFVVVGELFLWYVLRRRPAPKAPPAPPTPDPAEALLEQLLREAESKQKPATTPAPAAADNTRVTPPAG